MGASESAEIHVSFNRPNLFYFAGEQITGNISFQNTHEKLTLDEIFLEFIGEIGYTTREIRHRQDSNGRSTTENYTEYHRIPFVTHRIPVVRPQHGQVNISRTDSITFVVFSSVKLLFIVVNILGHLNFLFLNVYLHHQFHQQSHILM